ncbi:hypothetical protein CLAIMM_00660, partial [Cladophialophora immunda]
CERATARVQFGVWTWSGLFTLLERASQIHQLHPRLAPSPFGSLRSLTLSNLHPKIPSTTLLGPVYKPSCYKYVQYRLGIILANIGAPACAPHPSSSSVYENSSSLPLVSMLKH